MKNKLTVETKERLIEALLVGATKRIACSYAGISTATLDKWLTEAVDSDAPLLNDLYEEYQIATGVSAVKWLKKVEDEAEKNWKAATWKLERVFPDEYGRSNNYRVQGSGDGTDDPITFKVVYE